MKIETPKIKREKTDWDHAREVRKLMQEGKTFHQACNQILDQLGIDGIKERIFWKRNIGKICGEISGQARKKITEEKKEPTKETESLEAYRERMKRERIERAKAAAPLFAEQIEKEMEEEDKRRGF